MISDVFYPHLLEKVLVAILIKVTLKSGSGLVEKLCCFAFTEMDICRDNYQPARLHYSFKFVYCLLGIIEQMYYVRSDRFIKGVVSKPEIRYVSVFDRNVL